MVTDRPLPSNVQREYQLLGALLLMPDSARIIESIPDELFHDIDALECWKTVKELSGESTLDLFNFVERMEKTEIKFRRVVEEAGICPMPETVSLWIRQLKHLARLRSIISNTNTAMEAAWTGEIDPITLENNLINSLSRNSIKYGEPHKAGIAETVKRYDTYRHRIMELRARGSELKFGINEIEHHVMLVPSYGLILARTSHGKTAFMATAVFHQAIAGKHPVVFSMEQPDYQFFIRLVSLMMKRGYLHAIGRYEETEKIANDAVSVLSRLGITIVDGRQTPESIHATAARLKENGMCDCIWIDQLSRIDIRFNRGESKEQAMTRASNRLVDIKSDVDVPLIMLAQLGIKHGIDHPDPATSQVKDCSSIIEDCDWAFVLDRPEAEPDRLEKLEKQHVKDSIRFKQSGGDAIPIKGMMKISCTKDRINTMGGIWSEKVVFDDNCGHVGRWHLNDAAINKASRYTDPEDREI